MIFSVLSSVFITAVLLLHSTKIVCGQHSDNCDWIGSGLFNEANHGVQPIYLRCKQGRIKWHYPRGALRALLRPTLSPAFQGCVRVTATSSGARLYLEGERGLLPLHKPGQPEDLHRCFVSRKGGQVALYVEADPPLDPLRKDTMEFSYDLVTVHNLADPMEECRPCSDEEILSAYCTSEFIMQGSVTSLTHNTTTQTSVVTVKVAKAVRYAHNKSWGGAKRIALHRPLKCGTKSGHGEFVFMGRPRLGRPYIRCAPRLSHWKEIRRKALLSGANQCALD